MCVESGEITVAQRLRPHHLAAVAAACHRNFMQHLRSRRIGRLRHNYLPLRANGTQRQDRHNSYGQNTVRCKSHQYGRLLSFRR